MIRSLSIIGLVFFCIFFCVIVSVLICPVHAGEPIVDNAKKTDQVLSQEARDYGVKGNQQQEFIKTKGLEYITTKKDPKPKGAAFIRLRPKLEDDIVAGSQKIFDVVFMNDEPSEHKMKKDSDASTYLKFEKMEDPEKNNILIRKATEKDYKTELSMVYRMSPYSEIYLGKGFLVERKDNFNVDPRDDGWRIKFKFDF
jgi:hypothetical protein